MTKKPKVLLIVGHFDWFSRYQETALATALSRYAEVLVLAGTHVSPIFTPGHLDSIDHPSSYEPGLTIENQVTILRVPTRQVRAMVWSSKAIIAVERAEPDLIIQVMPGQLMPTAATLAKVEAPRLVLYGDNAAMYAALTPWQQKLKFAIFSATKGQLYRFVNSKATAIYGYTENTCSRLRHFSAGRPMSILPLTYDEHLFYYSSAMRAAARQELGFADRELVIIAPGKLQRQKRADLLLAAMDHPEMPPDVRLLIVGADSGEESRRIRQGAERLRHPDRVRILEFATSARLNELFNASDLGVWPAMPAITIQQAMGTGLPVAIPNNDYVRHLLRSRKSGTLLPTQPHAADILDAIEQLRKGVISRSARRAANSWLGNDAVARRLLADGIPHRNDAS